MSFVRPRELVSFVRPRELVSFVRPRELVSFDSWHTFSSNRKTYLSWEV